MGHYYQDLDAPHFDYDLQVIDGLGEKKYRGPAIDRSKPYIACIGAAQTYGRFVEDPFPHRIARALDIQVLNLGVGGAGPEHFLKSDYLDWLNAAELVIVQMLSGRSAGNSLFDNSRSGGLLGVRLSDFKEMRFEEFLEDVFATQSREVARRVVEETRSSFVAGFVKLLDAITAPRMLLWFSDRPADYVDDYSSVWSILNSYPQMINRPMLELIRPHCDAVVECVSAEGLPQPLWQNDESIDGAISRDGMLYNRYYPSPEMHIRAAELLVPACRRFIASPPSARSQNTAESGTADLVPFVILGAERTGSNLLVGLLASHPDCFMSGEVLNDFYVGSGTLPWISELAEREAQNEELDGVRKNDAVAFIKRYFNLDMKPNIRASGFKLMYGQVDQYSAVRDYIIADPNIRIVHLKRRNLLRRFVSERQATATGIWAQGADAKSPLSPSVSLLPKEFVYDVLDKEANAAKYDGLLEDKGRVLEVFYENLAAHPQIVGARVLRFLGLEPTGNLEVRFRKTGSESLRDVVTNYDELKARIMLWASFFDG